MKHRSFDIHFLVFSFALLILGFGCATPSRLSQSDNEANSHLVAALKLKNEAFEFLELFAANIGERQLNRGTFEIRAGSFSRDQEKEFRDRYIEKLSESLKEARLISSDFLGRAHPKLPEMWRNSFIPSVEGIRDYYHAAFQNPESPPVPSTLFHAVSLADQWSDWYEKNRDAIRAGIRSQAR